MNVSLNRRDFAKGLGGIVLAFTLDPAAAQQQPRAAARQPRRQPHAGRLDPHQCRRHRDRVHRQGGAGAGHRHRARADRRRRARPAARARHHDFRRHRAHAERRHDGRLAVDREFRHRAAAGGGGSARHPDRACLGAARDERGFAQRRRRRRSARRTARRSAMASLRPRSTCKREATATVRPKPAGLHKIVGQSIPRFDIPGKVTGKATYVQDLRLPGMVHGRVVRPPQYGATLRLGRRRQGEGDPGRDRGGARRLVPRRDRRARGAGGQGARRARRRPRKWKPGPDLPDPARLFAHLKSLPDQGRDHRRQAGAAARERAEGARGDLHQALHGACLDRPVGRGRGIQGRQAARSGPIRRACSRCAPRLAKALKVPPAVGALHPHRRLGLLRPQRRRRRGARRRAAGARRAGQAGAAAMDARRRVRLGAVSAPRWRCRRRPRSTPKAASSTGITSCGATRIRRVRSRPPARTCSPPGISPSRRRWGRRPRRRSRPAAATATPSRSTISRTRRWCTTSSRTCRSGCRRCARSAPTPTCSRRNPSWTSWRSRPAPIRSRSVSRT